MFKFRLSFEAYTKNIREKAAKCSLKTTEVLLDAMNVCLTKFDIYHRLKQAQTLDVHFLMSKFFSNVQFEIHLVRRNIISTGQSVRA